MKNIKEAEQLTGISSQNIRYYEKQGLICPARNEDNSYREYSDNDIERLKLIRLFRKLGMPIGRTSPPVKRRGRPQERCRNARKAS